MFAPSYKPRVEPLVSRKTHTFDNYAGSPTARLPGWRYGSMTPPEPSPWYRRVFLGSTTKRTTSNSIRRVEHRNISPRDGEFDETKPGKSNEVGSAWKHGDMMPPERWYDGFIPESIKRLSKITDIRKTNQVDIEKAKKTGPKKAEAKKGSFSDKKHGSVDFGHCAMFEDWAEQGACMCTITWKMPGRFPRSFCESVYNGTISRTSVGNPSIRPPLRKSPAREKIPPEPCWEVDPVSEEPEANLFWVKSYNPRLRRYEYVAKPWRPPPDKVEEKGEEGVHEDYREGREIGGASHGSGPQPSSPKRPSEIVENPFPCGGKPPWLQHVRKFVRAEELASPPPSAFVNKSGSLLGNFSERYFMIPYYDPEYRSFRYTEPCTLDLNNMKLKFNSVAPPPKPVYPQRPKALPKRPLVMAQKKQPVIIQMPEYDSRPVYTPPPVRVPIRPNPRPMPKPPAQNPYHSPRFVAFPPSLRYDQDDTPCPHHPPPQKHRSDIIKKRRVRFEDEDEEYQPSGNEESEGGGFETPCPPGREPPLEKVVRRKNRGYSDPTYRKHGVRENNNIEKRDLQQMYDEQVVENGNRDGSNEELSVSYVVSKPSFTPKSILKKGKERRIDVTPSKSRWLNETASLSETSRPKEQLGAPQKNPFHPCKSKCRKDSGDGEYILVRDREEERRERSDLHDMRVQVYKDAEEEEPGPGPETDPKTNNSSSEPKLVRPRRRMALEDRAYKPGRRV
ncbi:hypothetical protein TWF730_002154 [Orbilia blumenaviensis]|uniref:Uncharacterized protein n=1 Tax=Orbilia blumenaviensis TaxID=1796055 RepID=A0AAV9UHD2_9PEZI